MKDRAPPLVTLATTLCFCHFPSCSPGCLVAQGCRALMGAFLSSPVILPPTLGNRQPPVCTGPVWLRPQHSEGRPEMALEQSLQVDLTTVCSFLRDRGKAGSEASQSLTLMLKTRLRFGFLFCFQIGGPATHCVTQACLELRAVPLPPRSWGYGCESPHSADVFKN